MCDGNGEKICHFAQLAVPLQVETKCTFLGTQIVQLLINSDYTFKVTI